MEWFIFRKRKMPIITPPFYYFKPYNKAAIGVDVLYAHVQDSEWLIEMFSKESYDRAGKFFMQQLINDSDFLKKRLKQSRYLGEKFLEFCRSNMGKRLKSKKDEELLELLRYYYNFYQKFSVINLSPWVFMPDALAAHVLKKLSLICKKNLNEVFTTLSAPNFFSYTQQEELAVLSFAAQVKESRAKNFHKMPAFKRLIDKYFWIPFDYYGPKVYTEKHYINKISSLLGLRADELKGKMQNIFDYHDKLKEKQRQMIVSLGLPHELILLFDGLKDLAILQDEKKAITTESHFYLQQLFKELANRSKMDYFDFYQLLYEEIEEIILKKKNLNPLINERKKACLIVIDNGMHNVMAGKQALRYAKKHGIVFPSHEAPIAHDELRGVSASKGFASGKVRVIDHKSKMSSFREGEILVATMTTPDFVLIIKKAKAIITDEGGLTCHAAIISRELGIPCIIGTRNATSALKDGDKVEVDAVKGVVRKIKH